MKLKFDPNQDYQIQAIEAVTGLFDGQPMARMGSEWSASASPGQLFTELGTGNSLGLERETIFKNLGAIQDKNFKKDERARLEGFDGFDFTVEMETGTGKTYVYLRTIFELHSKYGWTKFIIVVPSVAIREGIVQSIRQTKEHFSDLYGNTPLDSWVYDSKQVSRLRQFSSSNSLQVLVMNIQAFDRDANVIRQDSDKLNGRTPLEFIQTACPIVIIDEPQNMESEAAKRALASLNSLFRLRYSATHKNPYNVVYRLDPVRAYDLRLVKRIEVDSVLDEPDFNRPYISVKKITATKTKVTAQLEIDVDGSKGVVRKTLSVSAGGVDLQELAAGREVYKGYIVDEIHFGEQWISFANGVRLIPGQQVGGLGEEIMKAQIRTTVERHFEHELKISLRTEAERLKVLSLFFIDRVANYADEEGKIRNWFIEAFNAISASSKYASLPKTDLNLVHGGYFASDGKKPKDSNGSTKADDEAYTLIMKDKERLLSMEEPLKFIFSHSALREGWDNPNVFQICTLNETKSEIKKRQEIGRGMRLPVISSTGDRCHDPAINRLTVIANEHYDSFAKGLQSEIETEFGVSFKGRIVNARERKKAKLNKAIYLSDDFKELWSRIKNRTRYSVQFSTEELIRKAGKELGNLPKIHAPKVRIESASLLLTDQGVSSQINRVRDANALYDSAPLIPDLVGYIQRDTELTRSTIAQILIDSGKLEQVYENPQAFLDQALIAIRKTLQSLMVEGVQYEKIEGSVYEMTLFENHEIESYLSKMIAVSKSVTDYIEFDSEVERRFAQELDNRDDIKAFVKLPFWFTVETPVGRYNPDWAIVKEKDGKIYFVRETKGTTDPMTLRASEKAKMDCGKEHFKTLGVDYDWIDSASKV
jgi:type III restriction enzyme